MKKFASLLTGLATVALTAGAAQAADLYTPAPEPAVSNWTGFWVGAGVGYGFVNHELDAGFDFDQEQGFVTGEGNLSGIGGEGWLGRIGGGYDFQLADRFVLGIFGDYTFSDIETSASIIGGGPIVGGSLEASYNLTAENSWFVGGRAGYLATPDTLLYGLIGYGRRNSKQMRDLLCMTDRRNQVPWTIAVLLSHGWTQGQLDLGWRH